MLGLDDKTWNLLGGMVLIVLAIGLSLGGIKLISYYRRQALEEEESISNEDQLAQFRESFEAGELDETEFRRIEAALSQTISRADLPPKLSNADRRSRPAPSLDGIDAAHEQPPRT